jgi:hypothetical protein
MDHRENTSHVIATQRVHWRADCCLATSYTCTFFHRDTVYIVARWNMYTELLPRNTLSKCVTIFFSTTKYNFGPSERKIVSRYCLVKNELNLLTQGAIDSVYAATKRDHIN